MDGEVKRLAFIGIGRMGWPMARRLVEAGYRVAVQDAAPGRAGDFAATHGGIAAGDAASRAVPW